MHLAGGSEAVNYTVQSGDSLSSIGADPYRTMPDHKAEIINTGGTFGGVILISQKSATRDVLRDLEIIVLCCEQE